jgi:hypothetical protein|tara:strand:- start:1166 stop:2116 length:951 start_codon:yes stop_codon:yes gene_type:complete
MAILRGGTKIFGQDIRIGLPRDRSMNNINGDPRFKQGGQVGQGESTINRFIAEINQGEGMARPTRYMVVIQPPQKIYTEQEVMASEFGGGAGSGGSNDLESASTKRNVGMMCNSVTMPSRDVNTAPSQQYGPQRRMPYAYSFSGELAMRFYGDKFLRQRLFFENWQKKIFDIKTHDMQYYDDYVGTMDIMQLGSFSSESDRDRVTYAVRLYEVYPQTIGSYDMAYGSTNEVVNVPITLNFRHWRNLTIDQVNNATVGQSFGDLPSIKPSKEFGLFGGILNRLPPEIQRAGRQVLSTAKRNLPIGRITGGRVFPPFL